MVLNVEEHLILSGIHDCEAMSLKLILRQHHVLEL